MVYLLTFWFVCGFISASYMAGTAHHGAEPKFKFQIDDWLAMILSLIWGPLGMIVIIPYMFSHPCCVKFYWTHILKLRREKREFLHRECLRKFES